MSLTLFIYKFHKLFFICALSTLKRRGDRMQAVERRIYHCVGCGGSIPWDGTGIFAYTCSCGATIFADQNGVPALPASLIIRVKEGRDLPHIDYYLGFSNHVSEEKQRLYEELQKLGAIWSWDCERCKERFLQRKRMEVKERLLRIDLHPELKKLL